MHRSIWLLAAVVAVAGVCLAVPALAGAATFSNPGAITIPASGTAGPADPYPSTIDVSGVTGTITDVNVTLTGYFHTSMPDVAVLLVGPTGANVALMAGPRVTSATPVTLTFDDNAASSLNCAGSFVAIVSGAFKPNDCFPSQSLASPAPVAPYGAALSAFNGTDANGTWRLYVQDFLPSDVGSISGGWSLDITVPTPEQTISDLQATVSGMGLPTGLTTALNSQLQEALDALAVDDTAGACDALQSFLSLVNAQTGKKMTPDQAKQLSDAANGIRTQLGC